MTLVRMTFSKRRHGQIISNLPQCFGCVGDSIQSSGARKNLINIIIESIYRNIYFTLLIHSGSKGAKLFGLCIDKCDDPNAHCTNSSGSLICLCRDTYVADSVLLECSKILIS